LEDGTVFEGSSFGAPVERTGEVVFNTAITGYQEVFTDPSYSGQIVVLTYPQIGNYGSNDGDNESAKPHIEGLVVREFSPLSSNWRADETAQQFLTNSGVPVISEIDTRRLVRHLRSRGVMRGVLWAGPTPRPDSQTLVERARNAPSMAGLDLATRVSTTQSYDWTHGIVRASPSDRESVDAGIRHHVVAYDFGIKRNILRRLVHSGCRVTVVPAGTTAEDVLDLKPDGVFLSNGPGDPEPLDYQAQQIRKLVGKTPIFGICLGHQILATALGGTTYKLPFGHHGANHPVQRLETGVVEITSQNHNYAVAAGSIPDAETTHVNLNDGVIEGFRSLTAPAFSVQYHPEAAPGPHDARYLFGAFRDLMLAHPTRSASAARR
jgi:carbamoyl-phosphate synthase small subunit